MTHGIFLFYVQRPRTKTYATDVIIVNIERYSRLCLNIVKRCLPLVCERYDNSTRHEVCQSKSTSALQTKKALARGRTGHFVAGVKTKCRRNGTKLY